MITIVDYGMGNLGSIRNMLKWLGFQSIISSDPDEIKRAQKLILPGVGAFDQGMKNLAEKQLISVLNWCVTREKIPLLGICLGMQLLTKHSEEGKLPGLGWINAHTIRFNFVNDKSLKIPHMGWNEAIIKNNSPLLEGVNKTSRYYFVHSYHVICNDKEDEILSTNYGIKFAAAVQKDNIFGVQFHPEKSHKFGMKILDNFSKRC